MSRTDSPRAAAFRAGAEAMREKITAKLVEIAAGRDEVWKQQVDDNPMTSAIVIDLLPDIIGTLPPPQIKENDNNAEV